MPDRSDRVLTIASPLPSRSRRCLRSTTVMAFHRLGPFGARAGGRSIPVATRRQERLLLAVLLLEAGRIVSIDRLTDLLWPGQPPRSARGAIHTYVGRLRRALAPH